MKTLKNKVVALVIALPGILPLIIDGDATAFLLTLIISVPLFLSKEDWIIGIEQEDEENV